MMSKAEQDQAIHMYEPAGVYEKLGSTPKGLTSLEALARLEQYGRNTITETRRKPIFVKLLTNFTHLMAILLWVGGIIGFFAGLPELGTAIWLVNLINGIFSFWQEFKAEKATEALRRMLPKYARVLRDGREERISAEDLVPGDVMILGEGDHISADARLVEDAEFRVTQAALTGESTPVRKTSRAVEDSGATRAEIPNLIFAGTGVAAGAGKAVVYAIGMETEFGKIAHLTQNVVEEPSPLQKEMARVTKTVSVIAVSSGVLFFILGILLGGMGLAEGFIFAMGMIVAFIPEGLVATVTLALAMGVQRMARRHALIKKLSAVETLGSTSVICTDKTGTLTKNEMTVREIWVSGQQLTVGGVGYAPEGEITYEGKPVSDTATGDLDEVLRAVTLCNNARLVSPKTEQDHWTILGDPTEAALKVVAVKGGINTDQVEKENPRVREFPFESRRKRMCTIHRTEGNRESPVAYVKGAPKEVLELCSRIRENGKENNLGNSLRRDILAVNDSYAKNGLRVLAVATRRVPSDFGSLAVDEVERDLTFLGLVAMIDPPRPEVAEAVEKCHRAGIRVVMITGDYGLTAESIARKIKIVRGPDPHIINGADLDGMDDLSLKKHLQGEVIFARVAPEHKLRVVTAFREMNQVVAVTGDGVNDAPALKRADIGVAMGITGTDVAKEAADKILTDDNFASIVGAVEEGRAVFANIKKFISYIFTSNTPEAVPFVLFAFSGGRIPLALTVMQILSIDLGTDMVPALALGVEPPEPGIMDRPPRNPKEPLITWPLLRRAYFWLGIAQSLAAMAAFYFIYWVNGYAGKFLDLPDSGTLYQAATAMTLAAVVTTQIGNLFAQRTERRSFFRTPLFNNRLIWVGILSELVLIFILVYVPFMHGIFGTAAFPLSNWFFLFALAPLLLVMDEIRKALARSRDRRKMEEKEELKRS